MAYIEELIRTLDARIEELNGEIASLEDARSALIADGAAAGAVRQPRTKPTAARTSGRRQHVLEPEAAERILAEADGLTAAEVARHAGAGRDQVAQLLRDLEAAGRARRTGHGRGTRWHVVTDEDWIRERAAELAGRRAQHRGDQTQQLGVETAPELGVETPPELGVETATQSGVETAPQSGVETPQSGVETPPQLGGETPAATRRRDAPHSRSGWPESLRP